MQRNYLGYNTASQVSAVTTLADIVGHSWTLPVGSYLYQLEGAYRSNATTTGLRIAVNLSAGGAASSVSGALEAVTGAAGATEVFAITALDTAVGSLTGPGAADVPFRVRGRIEVTTSGLFAFRLASEVAVALGITLMAGAMSRVDRN